MSHKVLTKISTTDVIELCTALRLTAERYGKHSRAAASTGNADSAEFWADSADRCVRLYTQIMASDDAYIATCTAHHTPGNTFEVNGEETKDIPGAFEPPF